MVIVGCLVKVKNYICLIEVLSYIERMYFEFIVNCIIVGEGVERGVIE